MVTLEMIRDAIKMYGHDPSYTFFDLFCALYSIRGDGEGEMVTQMNGRYNNGQNVGDHRIAWAEDKSVIFILTKKGAIRVIGNKWVDRLFITNDVDFPFSKYGFKVEIYESELLDEVCAILDSEERNRFLIKTPQQLYTVVNHLVEAGGY